MAFYESIFSTVQNLNKIHTQMLPILFSPNSLHLLEAEKWVEKLNSTISVEFASHRCCLACLVANLMLSHRSSFHEGLPWKKHAQALKTRTFSPHLVIFPADYSYSTTYGSPPAQDLVWQQDPYDLG